MKIEQFQSEVFDETPDADIERKKILEKELLESVEELLESQERKIGEGRTAEVHYPVHNEELCLKLIRHVEAFGKAIPDKFRNRGKEDLPRYNSLIKEGEFLAS